MNLLNVLQFFLESASLPIQNTVDYICGNGDALPLPLSAEEESECLKNWHWTVAWTSLSALNAI